MPREARANGFRNSRRLNVAYTNMNNIKSYINNALNNANDAN
jgi:hypothetical protein